MKPRIKLRLIPIEETFPNVNNRFGKLLIHRLHLVRSCLFSNQIIEFSQLERIEDLGLGKNIRYNEYGFIIPIHNYIDIEERFTILHKLMRL